ncbi:MAG: symmetrical bis(5'-nucleosyl)-tetraphosphatase [Gammaproteobacteria bacterium]|nr:symmetrical bis(5'-nucleosyl)-tetraphosphatase [Gammaproteobacteria bacterium]MCW8910990.1 symmetrical bis(5'-nucleosyl)-tetraphosphatase [Gammaproteobacteria bacterium]MCW9004335.1 symmetrical bis(5'-nucleosyl)-tetraphosphatase [Gammaproteobacteria bacterium]MCW9056812.1 symmetrical bis(5'-nucleosyl)-tetraphosphatase [Gammaproteobacteria bacterium]
MSIYAIGDIQGCYLQLQQLLDKLNFDHANDKLWFAGDIVNRGPDSLETLRFIKSLGENAITVLGNHDLHLLAVANGRGKQGKKDTIKDVLSAPDRDELLDWLLQRPLIHYDTELDICLVHAGIYPYWTIEQSLNYASEVEDMLRSNKHHEYFHHMYGDKPPKWSEHLKGWDRLRFITNVFTRMRYCMEDGHLALKDKSAPGSQGEGHIPWFQHSQRNTGNTAIIFGHWSTLQSTDVENLYPLDTGCLWGGKLTALRIDNNELNQYTSIDCPVSQPIDYKHGYKDKKHKG